ncbi:MAG TPA: cell division topological specificity factor MinE [Aquificales bacterium]|uniref:Cell division topological specificity factor n=1 Tax=Aquifex aeolicus TaxID=63363 RepID=A0A9D0YPL4_AQUAO|nr:cell division topological specificity factor MinE [Aquificales bacterium]HIP98341.1 cell division topological specificity factor MinE [Aquifex aeolicus]
MGLFNFWKKKKNSSAQEAKKRLTMVLEYERKNLPPNFADRLKEDLITIFAKYNIFDISNIEVEIKRAESDTTEELWISIPFKE